MTYETTPDADLVRYINLKFAALGLPTNAAADGDFMTIAGPLVRNQFEKEQQLGWPLCAADARIEAFLDRYLADTCAGGAPKLPRRTFVLDRPGLSRVLSLPQSSDSFASPYLTSYRLAQGVLHNPKSDRRTTKGVFHVAEGGLPIPADKLAVPKQAFAALLAAALEPPADVLTVPFGAGQPEPPRLFVSLLLRPIVCPATDRDPEKRMEIRFFAPGSLVSNLDFVEGIFGCGGDPHLTENDAAFDVAGWTGHTGCVLLAPHILGLKKKALGLPHYDAATERQRRDGMCWRDEQEPYNDGRAFKITCRDESGVMFTIIADNYYGYCKKEVKTQISFSANLFGLCEEEHAGGALSFPTYVLGENFHARTRVPQGATFERAVELLGDRIEVRPGRYAVDRRYKDVFYLPEDSEFHVHEGTVTWQQGGQLQRLTLRENDIYILPSGYKVRLEKQLKSDGWRLIGSRPDGVLCHKPCTVSGGGKSEISKSLKPMIQQGPIFVKDFERDMQAVADLVNKDYSGIFKEKERPSEAQARRPLLSADRSIGSVVKLLTPSEQFTDEHNAWARALPQTIRQLVFVLKRYYRPEWGGDFKQHFSVDRINGFAGHELKFHDQRLSARFLRVGFEPDRKSWRMYKLRPDFNPADKVQMEDDITASVVLPASRVAGLSPEYKNASVKIVANCEALLFQRPDDAIHRGFDHQAEADIATPGTFITNFEPLTPDAARSLVDHVAEFDLFTQPMKDLLSSFAEKPTTGYVVSSAHPRIVDGKPSKNPRYLQRRPDRVDHRSTYVAEIGTRLDRHVPSGTRVPAVVHAVLAGRRNNPPQPEIQLPALAVYNPIHYQELPELFMDFVSTLTGKSPSTTGFGSEGALTKGPFNALWPVVDMNNALVSAIITGYAGFTTAAGHIGPRYRVDHDISMLVPELWCRMQVAEREPKYLIDNGYLEKVEDFELGGRKVLASRLGYRITSSFVDRFLGRIFEAPNTVFTAEMLRPELQDRAEFAAGVDSIVDAQTRVAKGYFADGSVEAACPPLKALLHVMVHGHYDGMDMSHPTLRTLFTREAMLSSAWYQKRLEVKQRHDVQLWERHRESLERCQSLSLSFDLNERRALVTRELERVRSAAYLKELQGTLGGDPFYLQIRSR